MARVPLYNGGNPPPAPVGARVPMPAALPVGADGRAWSQALGNVTETLAVMAQKQAEANDTRQLIEAEGEMRKTAMEFQQFQQATTDQDQWVPEWQKRQNQLQKRIDEMKLTDGARLRLTQSFGRWADGHAIAIQGEAFKQSVGRAKQAVVNRATEAAQAGDAGGIASALALLPADYTTPEEREEIRLRLEAKSNEVARQKIDMQADTLVKNGGTAAVLDIVRLYDENAALFPNGEKENRLAGMQYEAEKQDLLVLSNDNPKVAMELARQKLRAPDAIRVERQAQERMRELRVGSIAGWKEAIATGRIPSETDLKADANLTDADRIGIIGLALEGAKNDPVTFQRVETAIDAYRPADGDALARANFESMLETNFSGPYLDTLKKKWTEKTTATAEIVETGEAFAALDKWAFDEQRLGKFKEQAMGEDGKPLLKKKDALYSLEKGWLWGQSYEQGEPTYEPVMKENPAARDKVAAQVSAIKETIKREKAEGKLLDSASVFRRMAELARIHLSASAANEATAPSMNSMPPINSLDGAAPPVSLLPSIDAILNQPHATYPRK